MKLLGTYGASCGVWNVGRHGDVILGRAVGRSGIVAVRHFVVVAFQCDEGRDVRLPVLGEITCPVLGMDEAGQFVVDPSTHQAHGRYRSDYGWWKVECCSADFLLDPLVEGVREAVRALRDTHEGEWHQDTQQHDRATAHVYLVRAIPGDFQQGHAEGLHLVCWLRDTTCADVGPRPIVATSTPQSLRGRFGV